MKRFFLALVVSATLMGCATGSKSYKTPPITAPSVGDVKNKVQEAQEAVQRANEAIDRANQASERLQKQLQNAQSKSKRIENKAIVILQNW